MPYDFKAMKVPPDFAKQLVAKGARNISRMTAKCPDEPGADGRPINTGYIRAMFFNYRLGRPNRVGFVGVACQADGQ